MTKIRVIAPERLLPGDLVLQGFDRELAPSPDIKRVPFLVLSVNHDGFFGLCDNILICVPLEDTWDLLRVVRNRT